MNILLIDDDSSLRKSIRLVLETMKHKVTEACDGAQAEGFLGHGLYDVAFLDIRLGREKGLDLLPVLLRLAPGLAVVVVTADATIETAVEAMRRGAIDYLPKPFTPDQIRLVLDRVSRIRHLQSHVEELEEQVRSIVPEADLQTQEPAMRQRWKWLSSAPATRPSYSAVKAEGKGVLAGNPRPQPAPSALRNDSLSEPVGRTPGKRAVRPREGGVLPARSGHHRQGRGAEGVHSFWTKSGPAAALQPKLCGCFRRSGMNALGDPTWVATSASWRPPTAIYKLPLPQERSVKIFSTA